jgi:peptide/nickel transport system ATP-binding protein
VNPLLEVRDLTVRFPIDVGLVYAVDRISFSLYTREVLAVVGESGCGKSVLALSILGLVTPPGEVTEGAILLDGLDLRRLPVSGLRAVRGKDIGIVFQEPMSSLNPVFTVGRQIGDVLRRHEGLTLRETRARTIELLRQVGIPAPERRADEYPHQLSGGMAQRVMIAIAIACHPKILIADEPTTALDVTIQAGILRLLMTLRERLGMAIILITHDLGVVADVADRVMVMYAGRKVEAALVEELFSTPQHPYTLGLLGAVRHPGRMPKVGERRRLQEIPGLVPIRREPARSCIFAPRCPRSEQRCCLELPPLESLGPGHQAACFYPGREWPRQKPIPGNPIMDGSVRGKA